MASRFVGAHRHWRETGLGVSSQAEEHTDPRRGEKGQVGGGSPATLGRPHPRQPACAL